MTRKKVLIMLGAVVLAVGIALAGIWYNAQLPPLAYPDAPAQDAEILFTTWADRYPAEGQTALTLRTTLLAGRHGLLHPRGGGAGALLL